MVHSQQNTHVLSGARLAVFKVFHHVGTSWAEGQVKKVEIFEKRCWYVWKDFNHPDTYYIFADITKGFSMVREEKSINMKLFDRKELIASGANHH